MKIDPKDRMGSFGVMTVGKFGKASLATCYGESLPTIQEVFAHVCELFNVPKKWRHLNRFKVVKVAPCHRLPAEIVLEEKPERKQR